MTNLKPFIWILFVLVVLRILAAMCTNMPIDSEEGGLILAIAVIGSLLSLVFVRNE